MIPQPPSTLLPHAFNSLLPDSPAFSLYSSCTEMLDCRTIFPRLQFHHAMSLLRNSPLVPNSHLIRSHPLGLAFQPLFHYLWASLVAQAVKNPPAMQKTRDPTPGWEDPLEKGMAAHTSILPGEPHGQRRLVGSVHGVADSQTRLSHWHFYFHIFHRLWSTNYFFVIYFY